MQKENLIKKEQEEQKKLKLPHIDLDTKKEIAKIGMTASMGITVATSFYMKNRTMKNLHIGAGVALVGFSFWHHMLYQPEKKMQKKEENKKLDKPKNEKAVQKVESSKEDIVSKQIIENNYSISLNNFFIELSIKGKLTSEEFTEFEKRIESLLEMYKVPSMNILLDITGIKGIELQALWDDLAFALKHLKEIKKVALVGDNSFEKYSVNIMDRLLKAELHYFEEYDKAHKWLLS